MTEPLKLSQDTDLSVVMPRLGRLTGFDLARLWGASHLALSRETDPAEADQLSRGLDAIRKAIEQRLPP